MTELTFQKNWVKCQQRIRTLELQVIQFLFSRNCKLFIDQLKMHTRLQSKCDRWQIVSSHGPTFRERLSQPLVRQSKGELEAGEGIEQVMNFLDTYRWNTHLVFFKINNFKV